MDNTFPLATVFVAIAVIFLAVAFRNFLAEQDHLTPARRAWIRIAIVFSVVAIGSCVIHLFL